LPQTLGKTGKTCKGETLRLIVNVKCFIALGPSVIKLKDKIFKMFADDVSLTVS